MQRLICALLSITPFVAISAPVATTYIVTPDGTGDFPTIAAAIAGASDFDVIELTDGIFTGEGNREFTFLGKAITLKSQSGNPLACTIDCEGHWGMRAEDGEYWNTQIENLRIIHADGDHLRALEYIGTSPRVRGCIFDLNYTAVELREGATPRIVNCVFSNCALGINGDFCNAIIDSCEFTGITRWAVLLQYPDAELTLNTCTLHENTMTDSDMIRCGPGEIYMDHCTLADNSVSADCALICCSPDYYYGGHITLTNCILAFTHGGSAGRCLGGTGNPSIDLTCCDVFGNERGAGECIDQQLSTNDNLQSDPLFCGPGDYTLNAGSLCSAQENAACGQIGAWPVACYDIYTFACCYDDIYCQVTIHEDCESMGGIWQIGVTSCDPNPCLAACCIGEDCYVMGEIECATASGTWMPERLTCDFNPCDAILHIYPDGSGEFPTIGDALPAAEDGATILLADGIFTGPGNWDLSFPGISITLESESGDPTACVIDAGAMDCGIRFETSGPPAFVRGVTIRNAAEHAVSCTGSSPAFQECIFAESGAGANSWTGSSFEGCIFADNAE